MFRYVENIDLLFRYQYTEFCPICRLSDDCFRYVIMPSLFLMVDFIFLHTDAGIGIHRCDPRRIKMLRFISIRNAFWSNINFRQPTQWKAFCDAWRAQKSVFGPRCRLRYIDPTDSLVGWEGKTFPHSVSLPKHSMSRIWRFLLFETPSSITLSSNQPYLLYQIYVSECFWVINAHLDILYVTVSLHITLL